MVSAFLQSLTDAPANVSIMALCMVLAFITWNRGWDLDAFATSWEYVVTKRQFYRVVSAAFTHDGLLHILFNVASLYYMGVMESYRGTYYYVCTSILLILLTDAIMLLMTLGVMRCMNRPEFAQRTAVGYSGVLFGWQMIFGIAVPNANIQLFGMLNVPALVAPFASLIIIQLMVPRSSFLGHAAGIVAGSIVELGLFAWLTGYWFWTTVAILTIIMIISIKANPDAPAWLTRWIVLSPAFMATTGLGGTQEDIAAAAAPQTRRYMDNGQLHVVTEGGAAPAPAAPPPRGRIHTISSVAAAAAPTPAAAASEATTASSARAAAPTRPDAAAPAPPSGSGGIGAAFVNAWQRVTGGGGSGYARVRDEEAGSSAGGAAAVPTPVARTTAGATSSASSASGSNTVLPADARRAAAAAAAARLSAASS